MSCESSDQILGGLSTPMPGKPFIIVAIDGGAAAGKSSTARALSERFNLLHADTGSYYRAVTAEMLRRGALRRRPGLGEGGARGPAARDPDRGPLGPDRDLGATSPATRSAAAR